MSSNESRTELDLKTFLAKHQVFKCKVDYTFNEIRNLIEEAKVYYQHENSALCEIAPPINIVGDIHGQYGDLQRIFAALGLPGGTRYLFLGDYVDRGPQSLECICSLLAYKLTFPKRIFLLRGNHESDYVNRIYGFWDELQSRFSVGIALKLYKMFNELFSFFPLAALVRDRILCMHGGISPHLKSINDIRKIRMPVMNVAAEGLSQDLLWSDPKPDVKGYDVNELRECSVVFGEDAVHKACKKLGIDLIVRAHQVMKNGYAFFANRRLVTVFSAPRYVSEMNNKGAILQISNRMVISFMILNPVKPSTAGAEAFKSQFKDNSASAYSNNAESMKVSSENTQ